MKIKKLEVVGFKSFLEKTSFSFEVPVTSIVGPNGCGKSNVVDALKWVTGELSYKELRGRSMEDLIFAGSELRPPTSMMEVALTLDNDRGLAPVQFKDFTEITVLRRIFRDGSSEFFINKTECRLKDILELFLDTGIGQSSYSIIEQGRVGAIVAGRPEDRRLIIEEAAGITKFKHRKVAAQRKMEATKQNLLRVSDIIAELKRQIASLERQAQKAEKFRVMRDRAKEIDTSLLSRDLVLGQQTLEALLKDEENILQSSQSDETFYLEKESLYETARLDLLEKEKILEKHQQDLFEKKSLVQNTENKIQSESREVEFLKQQISENKERMLLLDQQIADSQQKSQEIDHTQKTLSEELSALQEELAENVRVHQEVSASLKELEKVLNDEKDVFLKTSTKEATLSQQKKSFENRLREIEARLQEIDRQIADIESQKQTLELSAQEKRNLLDEVVQLKFNFEANQETLKKEIETLQSEKQNLMARQSETSQKLEGARSRLKTLEEFIQSYGGYRKGVKTVMGQKETIGGVLALLGEVIHSQRGYERAVEAALSELIECILVDQRQDAFNIIQHLKDQKGGRGTFVSKVAIFSSREMELSHFQGVKGWLTDFVRIDGEYESFVKGLLSSTLLVDTLDNAIKIWESGTHINMVTPAGDRITEKGFISGGDWSEETGVLEIHNQADEMRESSIELAQQKLLIDQDIETNQKILLSKSAELKDVQLGIERESKKSIDVEREVQKILESIKVFTSKAEYMQQERSKLEGELQKIREDQSVLDAQYAELLSEKQTSESKQTEQVQKILEVREVVAAHAQRGTEMKVRKASIHERLDGYVRELKNLSSRVEQAQSEKATLSSSVETSEIMILEKSDALKKLDQDKVEFIATFHEFEKQVQELRSVYDTKTLEIVELESQIKALRQQKEAWVEQVSALRMNIHESRLKLDRIKEQALERYALDIFEYISTEGFTIIDESLVEEVGAELQELKDKMAKAGDVNLAAIGELEELKTRFDFLTAQREDLDKSLEDLSSAIKKINSTTKEMFEQTFEAVNQRFQELFPHLFRGGKAKLVLTNPEETLESGIDIVAQPPGKKLQNMNLLSGGEKALTAIALLFAIFEFKAPPVCVLDEVDAPLDEVNVGRFLEMVKTMSQKTQFIVITHNKNTMEIADNLYGVTMEEPGVSRVVSVRVQKVVEHARQHEPEPEAILAAG